SGSVQVNWFLMVFSRAASIRLTGQLNGQSGGVGNRRFTGVMFANKSCRLAMMQPSVAQERKQFSGAVAVGSTVSDYSIGKIRLPDRSPEPACPFIFAVANDGNLLRRRKVEIKSAEGNAECRRMTAHRFGQQSQGGKG